jgi:hypothetical protein
MALQTLMWTTLPNGMSADGRSLHVSVMLSPRLDPGGDPAILKSFFPDWEDWPLALSNATFHITYGGAPVKVRATQMTGPNRVDDRIGVADSTVWRAMFTDKLLVRGFTFKDLSKSEVLSYDTAATEGLVRGLYTTLARSADSDMPLVSDLVDDPGWSALVKAVTALDGRLAHEQPDVRGMRDVGRQFETFRTKGLKFGNTTSDLLATLQLFHTPPLKPAPVIGRPRDDDSRITTTWMEYDHQDMPAKEDLAKQLDFHQVVAAMNSYPTLLRRLGLVVDLVIDRSAFTLATDAPLQTIVDFPTGTLKISRSAKDVSPITHARLTVDRFQPVSDPHLPADAYRVKDGLLELERGRFTVLQTDVDGAALKLMSFARTLARLGPEDERADPVTRLEKEIGAPALRTPGLLLAQTGRGATLKDRFGTNKTKNERGEKIAKGLIAADALQFWAEDLVRGFRFDVWDRKTHRWHSLVRREAAYSLNDGAVTVTPKAREEEAIIRLGATTSPDPSSNADIVYLHEVLLAWSGWSLGAPPPGRAIKPDDSHDKAGSQSDAELPPGMKFSSRFRAASGSLPRLRFGREYWMRGRVVDLAGNSLDYQDSDFGPEMPKDNASAYLRYEPVESPAIALLKRSDGTTEPPAEGESMQRIAIRSFNDTPADNTVPSAQVARRVAIPPQVSARHAEHHGRLDAAGKVDATTFNMLANQRDFDATQPGAALIEEQIPLKGPLDLTPVGVAFAVYRDGASLTYLPDPLAEMVAVRIFGHPDIPNTTIIRIPLYPTGTWPEAQPFRIEAFEQPGDVPHYDPPSRTLLVPLGKAERAKVRLSFQLSKQALREEMGIWRWIPEAERPALEQMALDGQHWMLTPWRDVEVVHAVQRPLITPGFLNLRIDRGSNDTSAVPRLVASCSLKSTDRIDLMAEWHEPQDDISRVQITDPHAAAIQKALIDRSRRDTAFATKVTDPASYATRDAGQKLGGVPEHTIEADDVIGVGWKSRDLVLTKTHEFHDTRYRRIEYWIEATTKFREYMPPAVLFEPGETEPTEKNIRVVGPRRVAWIPSSSTPPAPEVLYVVPTFGWVRTAHAQGNPSTWRRGGGLRVYLNRPWSVSGYGEMLAVVLPPSSFKGDPDAEPEVKPYQSYVTQWGNDPIWQSPFVAGIAPRRSNFPLSRTQKDPAGAWLPDGAQPQEADQPPDGFRVDGLIPPGVPSFLGGPVEIAPHDVYYDADRRLWYCDIEVDQGGSYWPFIRLALARYQPVSIDGAHLSEVVLADFMPLTADRWLNVNRTNNSSSIQLNVFGQTFSDSSGHQEAARAPSMSLFDRLTGTVTELTPVAVSPTSVIEAWVELLDPAKGEDFGWERIDVAPQAAAAPATPRPNVFEFEPADEVMRAMQLHRTRRFTDLAAEGLVGRVTAILKLWEGHVELPASRPEGARFRLVVAEFEEYLVDDDRPYDIVPTKKNRRLVFVEHIELA